MHISRIAIKHIDLEDDSFSLTPSFISTPVPPSLTQSIKRSGILHPPIVKEKAASTFAIVSGRQRLLAAIDEKSPTSCDCLKIGSETSDLDTLSITLEDKLLSRPLTAIERATFFQKALQWTDEESLAKHFLPIMGLSASPFLIQKDLKLLELEEPLVAALHENILDEKVALELGKLSFSDRMALFAVISALKLSVGNQKKITIISREVAVRQNSTILAVLHAEEVDAIINHPEANNPQKTANLMKWLTEQRFPRLSQAEKEFHHFVKALELPREIKLDHSPSFEKDELLCTMSCKDRQHFQAIWEKIRNLFPASN